MPGNENKSKEKIFWYYVVIEVNKEVIIYTDVYMLLKC